jgi:Ni/Fe-hydrogenase 1 B-type cytochrome subunit
MCVLSISCLEFSHVSFPSGELYLAFFSRFHADWKDFLAWTDVKASIEQIKFYLLLKKRDRNIKLSLWSDAIVAYIGLMFMVAVIVVTGLILMGAGYHAGFTAVSLIRYCGP